jgi:hypothetical protein
LQKNNGGCYFEEEIKTYLMDVFRKYETPILLKNPTKTATTTQITNMSRSRAYTPSLFHLAIF